MKFCIVVLLATGILAVAGCSQKYVITTGNGTQIMTSSKPRLKEGAYVFKDAAGQPSYVPAGRVREIAPASMAKESRSQFIAPTAK